MTKDLTTVEGLSREVMRLETICKRLRECERLCKAIAAYWGNGVCEAPIYPGAYLTEEDIPICDLVRCAVAWEED